MKKILKKGWFKRQVKSVKKELKKFPPQFLREAGFIITKEDLYKDYNL